MMMKKAPVFTLLLLFLFSTQAKAQEYYSVPLDHAAYDLIELGIMRGLILQLPSAKPLPLHTVKAKLSEMLANGTGILSQKEYDIIVSILNSFERKDGWDSMSGRHHTDFSSGSIETGFNLTSNLSADLTGINFSSIDIVKWYLGGDIADNYSWNLAASAGLFYIERNKNGDVNDPQIQTVETIPAAFPYTASKSWDGGLASYVDPNSYSPWPQYPSLGYALEGEVYGVFFDGLLQLRLGRMRREWGPEANRNSLFLNSGARPFLALEGIVSPLYWINISFLNGALEYYREEYNWPAGNVFTNMLSAILFEFDPVNFLHLELGSSAVWFHQINWALFANAELRLPANLKLWGSFYIDNLNSDPADFILVAGNSFAYQAGIKAAIRWLPFASFSLRYTKIEPYCYTDSYDRFSGKWIPSPGAFISGGESLGYYLPPNSDEFLIGLDSILSQSVRINFQFQMIRHGADFGYGAVSGSSLRDKLENSYAVKHFLMDGVYQWENIIRLRCVWNLEAKSLPAAFFAEAGLVSTRYTVNGTVDVGKEAEYESLSDAEYRAGSRFILSIGFKIFPGS